MSERMPSSESSEHRDLRERFLKLDAELVRAANALAQSIRALPHDPACPDVDPRCFLVGGFVRDLALGLEPKDADLEVYGVSQERLESVLKQLFGGRVNAVGRAYAVYKIALGAHVDLDVAMPRRESKTGEGHKDFIVTGDPSMTPEEAARRRDFTMNAMLADPLTGEVVDPFNGLRDVKERVLRVTDAKTFIEDPLRVYRALQFVGRFGLTAAPETKELMRKMVAKGELDHLPPERVTEEIAKLLLKSPRPSVGFELARELGIIERDYPEFAATIGVEQEKEWHPEGDVWTHTMLTTDAAAEIVREPGRHWEDDDKLDVMLGALGHDLGKPKTTAMVDGRIHSYGHEAAGADVVKALMKRWSFGADRVHAAVMAAANHLRPVTLADDFRDGKLDERQFVNAVRRLLKRISPTPCRVIVAVSEADIRGRLDPTGKAHADEVRKTITETVEKHELEGKGAEPLVSGDDLKQMGFTPGPIFGRILKQIEQERDEGKVSTKEEGLARARALADELTG